MLLYSTASFHKEREKKVERERERERGREREGEIKNSFQARNVCI